MNPLFVILSLILASVSSCILSSLNWQKSLLPTRANFIAIRLTGLSTVEAALPQVWIPIVIRLDASNLVTTNDQLVAAQLIPGTRIVRIVKLSASNRAALKPALITMPAKLKANLAGSWRGAKLIEWELELENTWNGTGIIWWDFTDVLLALILLLISSLWLRTFASSYVGLYIDIYMIVAAYWINTIFSRSISSIVGLVKGDELT